MLHADKKKPSAVSSNDDLVACLVDEVRGLRDDMAAWRDAWATHTAPPPTAPPAPVVELREPAAPAPTIPIWAPEPGTSKPTPPADKPKGRR